MNEAQIRKALHCTLLQGYHAEPATRVINEFGIQHGTSRADIVVINGHLTGYEIKSDKDSLRRLNGQIESYGAVFDWMYIIVAPRHLNGTLALVPPCWGVITATEGPCGNIEFKRVRTSERNTTVDDYTVAQLLWRNEAIELLMTLGVKGPRIREPRSNLYRYLVEILPSHELRHSVRTYLKKRQSWQRRELLSPSDD